MASRTDVPIADRQFWNFQELCAALGKSDGWVRANVLPLLTEWPLSQRGNPVYLRAHVEEVLRDRQATAVQAKAVRAVRDARRTPPTLRRVARG